MGQPVKLSDELILEARVAAAAMERSIAGQVEFWARMGMVMERRMTGEQMGNLVQKVSAESLWERITQINKPEGRARLEAYLASKPFPRFRAHPTEAQVFVREDADGTKTVGRFKGREFVPVETAEHV